MSTLILVEHDNQVMQPTTLNLVAAAKALSKPIILLVAGFQCQAVATAAAKIAGVQAVWSVDDECYAHSFAENLSQLVVSLAESFTTIMAAANTYGKNIMPRVAALLDVAQISDVIKIIDSSTFQHPIYAGNAIETVKSLDNKYVLTIRTTAFNPILEQQAACSIEHMTQNFTHPGVRFIQHLLNTSVRPELTNAKIIVSGGRGLQNAENFKLIEALADALGAAVGASRAAVDAGFVANDYQVGQTGKIVAPLLYIAIGISGAVQHIAGMKDAKVIVAINKDPDAPIFQIANYGLVGDLFEIVPQLIDALKQ